MKGKAKPILKDRSGMNKTEAAYAQKLDLDPAVLKWKFESIKFKLAPKTFYTPDFMVTKAGHVEIVEVKGFWRDDARVKIKVAAELFPEFLFVAVQKTKGGWNHEYF